MMIISSAQLIRPALLTAVFLVNACLMNSSARVKLLKRLKLTISKSNLIQRQGVRLLAMLIGSAHRTVASLAIAESLTSCARMIRVLERGAASIAIVIQDAVITTNALLTGSVMLV